MVVVIGWVVVVFGRVVVVVGRMVVVVDLVVVVFGWVVVVVDGFIGVSSQEQNRGSQFPSAQFTMHH